MNSNGLATLSSLQKQHLFSSSRQNHSSYRTLTLSLSFSVLSSHYHQTPSMDMDFDIPLPEELEFLESNSHFPEEQQQDHHYYFPELELDQQPPSDLAVPSETESNGHKRSRPNSPPEEEKRAKARVVNIDEDLSADEETTVVRVAVEEDSAAVDEDWLRYSPPPPELVVEETRFVKEKTLSRFASEIDGECMPVTAPNGDRVYAKLNRFQGEERVTKLDCNRYSAGTNFSFNKPTIDIQFLIIPRVIRLFK